MDSPHAKQRSHDSSDNGRRENVQGRRRALTAITGLAAALLSTTGRSALAQALAWPHKPVRIIVPFPPGGSTDIATRAVAEKLQVALGQSMVVENRVGASGNVGQEAAARAAPDGYTLLFTGDSLASAAHLGAKLGYNPLTDFVPVALLARQPIVLAVHPSLNVNTVAELVAVTKQRGELSYATSGVGTGQHLVGEWFAKIAGIKLVHVPYKGGGQAIVDLLGGQILVASLGSSPVMPHYKSGRLRILAQSTEKRSASLPDVPTYQEAGISGLVIDQWQGAFAPIGTPPEVIERLAAEIHRGLSDRAVRDRLASAALDAGGGSPAEFAQYFKRSYEQYEQLFKAFNIKVE